MRGCTSGRAGPKSVWKFGWGLKHGWSQDVFADKTVFHPAHVREIERGESNAGFAGRDRGKRQVVVILP